MSNLSAKDWLSVREAAEALGVHENTIRNWSRKGILRSGRIPGATAQRFARQEIQRLLDERGKAAASIAPVMMTDFTDLVGPSELAAWANRSDAKTAFPELMSRLLAATPGISNLDMPSHEGTAAHGWDGRADSTGSPFVPRGKLRFELSCDAGVKKKAQSDYDKRAGQLPADAEAIFCFATPRSWPDGHLWARDRADESHFAGVEVWDARRLADWLRETPSVHVWVSERLGFRPRDVATLAAWWRSFASRQALTLPPAFFRAGREHHAATLRELVARPVASLIAIRGGTTDDAVAFVHASFSDNPELLQRTVVVSSAAPWQRLADSRVPLILIADFADLDLEMAMRAGHHVIVTAGAAHMLGSCDLDLPKVDAASGSETLRREGMDAAQAAKLTGLARRDFAAFLRSIARDPRYAQPKWIADRNAVQVLTRLALVGIWPSKASDQAAIADFVASSPDDIESLLRLLVSAEDPPFVKSGDLWQLASPNEAARLLFPKLTRYDRKAWVDFLRALYLDPDPFRALHPDERLPATFRGEGPRDSDDLRAAAATQFALLAAHHEADGSEYEAWIRNTARVLLTPEGEDAAPRLLLLDDVLPLIAEAAPDEFLDAVEDLLAGPASNIAQFFTDRSDALFGVRSPHVSLTWALEVLCWHRAHFPRSARALATLADADPGGRLGNRPGESLCNVLSGWVRNSGVSASEKTTFLSQLLQARPRRGWLTLMGVMPERHAVSMSPSRPLYRDWAPSASPVHVTEWQDYIDDITELMLAHVGSLPDRWIDVIEHLDDLPRRVRTAATAQLSALDRSHWSPDERYAVWAAFRAVIDRHRAHPDAEWSMPADEVEHWQELSTRLQPSTDPRVYAHLFDWPMRLDGLKYGDPGFDSLLERQQREAITTVSKHGAEAVALLAVASKVPHLVGRALAIHGSDSLDATVLAWLGGEPGALVEAACSLASVRMTQRGADWLREVLTHLEPASPPVMRLAASAPTTPDFWPEVSTLGEEFESAYWSQLNPHAITPENYSTATRLLLAHGQAWSAISVLGSELLHESQPDPAVVKQAIALAISPESASPPEQGLAQYHLQQLLEYLERESLDDPELAGFELALLNWLPDHKPNRALYRALGDDPQGFASLVKVLFRSDSDGTPDGARDEPDVGDGLSPQAHLAFSVLNEWPRLPGLRDDGSVDFKHLHDWVTTARALLNQGGRGAIGDEMIGQILASSPPGSDGSWPHDAVRELIETLRNPRIEQGLHIGVVNRRGVTSRGIYEGGKQERELASNYNAVAERFAVRWPRTARVLRGLADDYSRQARSLDAEAERRADHG